MRRLIVKFMHQVLTFLLGASPVLEIRGAIPAAVGVFKFTVWEAFLFGVLGNLAPIVPLLWFWNFASNWVMRRWYWANLLLTAIFTHTRRKHQKRFNYTAKIADGDLYAEFEWGSQSHPDHKKERTRSWAEFFALYLFVALPLPFTGMWSGTIVAFVFGVPFWRAVASISLGVVTSGLLTSLVVMGIIALPFF